MQIDSDAFEAGEAGGPISGNAAVGADPCAGGAAFAGGAAAAVGAGGHSKVLDPATGEIRVVAGKDQVFLGPHEKALDGGKQKAVEATEPEALDGGAAYRLRFFNFNMANSNSFPGSIAELQGPGGRGSLTSVFTEPFCDGHPVDVAFITLVETRLAVADFVTAQLNRTGAPLDLVVSQNASREGSKNESRVGGWVQGLAADFNGNLKTVLAFSSKKFEEDRQAARLFGRLIEKRVAGLAVPNPKKAFIGRTLTELDHGVRIIMAGAHFPIANVAASLEEPSRDPLEGAKVAMARILRRVLRNASRRGMVDASTMLLIQGDLNSRTVLQGGSTGDVLMELMRDESMQAAIQHQLGLPPGRFEEVCRPDSANSLPVTYKFGDDPRRCSAPTIGDVMRAAASGARPSESFLPDGPDAYKKTLQQVPEQLLSTWSIVFKEKDFKPFRFPACPDRVIYWAPHALHSRISWSLPRGGYEVNPAQGGSDHRPVALEAMLHIAAEAGPPEKPADFAPPPLLAAEVRQSDSEDSAASGQRGPAGFWRRLVGRR